MLRQETAVGCIPDLGIFTQMAERLIASEIKTRNTIATEDVGDQSKSTNQSTNPTSTLIECNPLQNQRVVPAYLVVMSTTRVAPNLGSVVVVTNSQEAIPVPVIRHLVAYCCVVLAVRIIDINLDHGI